MEACKIRKKSGLSWNNEMGILLMKWKQKWRNMKQATVQIKRYQSLSYQYDHSCSRAVQKVNLWEFNQSHFPSPTSTFWWHKSKIGIVLIYYGSCPWFIYECQWLLYMYMYTISIILLWISHKALKMSLAQAWKHRQIKKLQFRIFCDLWFFLVILEGNK